MVNIIRYQKCYCHLFLVSCIVWGLWIYWKGLGKIKSPKPSSSLRMWIVRIRISMYFSIYVINVISYDFNSWYLMLFLSFIVLRLQNSINAHIDHLDINVLSAICIKVRSNKILNTQIKIMRKVKFWFNLVIKK